MKFGQLKQQFIKRDITLCFQVDDKRGKTYYMYVVYVYYYRSILTVSVLF